MEKLTLSDLQKEELRATFNKFKPNENDKINIQEVNQLCLEIKQFEWFQQQVEEEQEDNPIIYEFPNGCDELNFQEFIKEYESKLENPDVLEEILQLAFYDMDVSKSGKINAEDLTRISRISKEPIQSDEESRKLLKLFNPQNKEILYEDFKNYFVKDHYNEFD